MPCREFIDMLIDDYCRAAREQLRYRCSIIQSVAVKKKLTKAEKLVQEQMLAMLEWASDNPTRWHNIGKLDATREAARLLAARGVIEIWPETNQYRLLSNLTK